MGSGDLDIVTVVRVLRLLRCASFTHGLSVPSYAALSEQCGYLQYPIARQSGDRDIKTLLMRVLPVLPSDG